MIARSFVGIGLAYALGSLCAGYYLVRWRTGRDVRPTGSASAGARLLGPGGFVLVLTFDLLKGQWIHREDGTRCEPGDSLPWRQDSRS